MRKMRRYIKDIFVIYCFAYGLLQTLYILQSFILRHGGWIEKLGYVSGTAVYSALIFSLTHFIITSECLDEKISVRGRVFLCALPSSVAIGYIAYELGLHNFMYSTTVDLSYVLLRWAALLVSFIVYMITYWLVEWRYMKQGKMYDVALQEFKEKNNATLC